ncbi:hypothetical protein DERP_001858 [Dermatophagoides pteronyssinus]|uniref:Uncharacterized protein n=1 Tax=Dermatophagoides pteronyssinus TaxID=6956 RepID=A0ABQ8JBP2_DERPT|nr:hypothetical protein DERP_001858 [Dermatophagoides pteronyssinus]
MFKTKILKKSRCEYGKKNMEKKIIKTDQNVSVFVENIKFLDLNDNVDGNVDDDNCFNKK